LEQKIIDEADEEIKKNRDKDGNNNIVGNVISQLKRSNLGIAFEEAAMKATKEVAKQEDSMGLLLDSYYQTLESNKQQHDAESNGIDKDNGSPDSTSHLAEAPEGVSIVSPPKQADQHKTSIMATKEKDEIADESLHEEVEHAIEELLEKENLTESQSSSMSSQKKPIHSITLTPLSILRRIKI